MNLGQREDTIDFENSNKVKKLTIHCLWFMKVFRDYQEEKEVVKEEENVDLPPGEGGKSIEVI